MTERFFHIEIITSEDGLKAEINGSPSLWAEIARIGGSLGEGMSLTADDDLSLEVELRGEDRRRYRRGLARIDIIPGKEGVEPTFEPAADPAGDAFPFGITADGGIEQDVLDRSALYVDVNTSADGIRYWRLSLLKSGEQVSVPEDALGDAEPFLHPSVVKICERLRQAFIPTPPGLANGLRVRISREVPPRLVPDPGLTPGLESSILDATDGPLPDGFRVSDAFDATTFAAERVSETLEDILRC
ncbi:MAG: hypothetical protein ACRDLB_03965, partial [Actinomycetota bacterium]